MPDSKTWLNDKMRTQAEDLIENNTGARDLREKSPVDGTPYVNLNPVSTSPQKEPESQEHGNPFLYECLDCLRQLCELKEHKDSMGKTDFYKEQQPKLWQWANNLVKAGYKYYQKNPLPVNK